MQMVGRYAFIAIAVIGFVILVIPRGESSASEDGDWVAASHSDQGWKPRAGAQKRSSTSTSSWNGGDHTLTRRGDGHFYASTDVNGRSVRMLVDTGASVIALTGADARAAGIHWDESAVRPIARGASGDVYGVPVMIEEVSIGMLTQRNVRAMIIPNGLDVSLLGQSYLSRLGSVEINGDQMQLSGN